MALTDIEKIRLLVGDTPTSPFYMLFSDAEIQAFIDMTGTLMQAARMAAIAASLQLAGWSSRERTADIEVWSNLSTAYIKALDNFIKDSSVNTLPNGLMPYAAGISWQDVNSNNADCDNVRTGLSKITVCDKYGQFFNEDDPFNLQTNCGC